MKEVKSARIKLEQLLDRIEAQVAFYDDNLRFESGGDTTEKKTVRLQRDTLYKEIWDISLSKVAKKYDVPYDRLKAACTKAKIPLPTQSYWGSIQAGKTVQKTPLPESSEKEVLIEFSYRKKATGLRLLLDEPAMKTEPAVPSTPEIVSAMRDSQNGRIIYNRETLYQEVWEQPVSKVAKKYGVSDVMIHKACKALNVPVPPRGYWAKIQAGQIVPKEPLPDASGKTALIGRRTENKAQEQKVAYTASIDSMSFLPDEERTRVIETALELWVDPDCKKLHPVLQKHKAAFSAWSKQHPRDKYANWNRDTYRSKPKDEPPLWESVTEETLPRVHRFLDPLYRAVEELGGKICDDLSMEIRGEHVSLKITEGRDQTPHVLTKDEIRQVEKYEQEKKKYHYAYEPKFRKYDYVPTGKLRVAAYGESYVRDTSSAGVEERIGEILLALYLQSEDVRIEREKREEAQRKAEEEKRQKELRRQKYNEEVDRLYALTNEARDFETACRIRAYVAAVEERPDLDVETINWVTWAKAKADWYDPTVAAVDPVFGKRDHSADKKEKTPEKKDSYHYW
jgi:hypothetical protein